LLALMVLNLLRRGRAIMQWWAHFFVLCFEVTHVGKLKVPCLLLTQYPITITNLVKKFGGKGFYVHVTISEPTLKEPSLWQWQVYIVTATGTKSQYLLQLYNRFFDVTAICWSVQSRFWGLCDVAKVTEIIHTII
jgi:hypothetical protein